MNRKAMMKRALFLTVSLGLCTPSALPVLAEEDLPSRAIAVVYDDSGSMYKNYSEGVLIDTWSQAKYSMEVFAAMLNPKDSMEIYYMSDYEEEDADSGPRLTLDGNDSAKSNIKKLHEEKTKSEETPFETVKAAYEGLEESDAEEKWLVILTDGEFRRDGKPASQEEMDAFYADKDEEINLIFLAMGPEAQPIEENPDENIYVERAADTSQILEKLTDVSHRVFNSNSLNVDTETGEFTLDIPSSSLTVFVQGDGAKIQDLVDENGNSVGIKQPSLSVSANRSSDNTNTDEGFDKSPADTELEGELAVFEGDFAPGTYKVQAKNARTIEVYYKPNLDVVTYLVDSEGNRIDNSGTELPTGDYTIHFELVSGLDGRPLDTSNSVLQSEYGVEYQAVIRNNGQLLGQNFENGETFHVDNGNLEIEVTANYLKYNHKTAYKTYDAKSEKAVEFSFPEDNSSWILKGKKLSSGDEPYTVKMTVDDKTPTGEEWAEMDVPAVSITTANGAVINTPIVQKDSEPGQLIIAPDPEQSEFAQTDYGQAEAALTLSMDQKINNIPWQGTGESTLPIRDKRWWFQKDPNWWKILLWLIPVALLVLSYLFKKRLPKMAKKPAITCTYKNRRSTKPKNSAGYFTKNKGTVWMPILREKGTIRVLPDEVAEYMPQLQVRADKERGQMELVNISSFQDEKIKIGGVDVGHWEEQNDETTENSEKKQNTFTFSPSDLIEIEINGDKYSCDLSESAAEDA